MDMSSIVVAAVEDVLAVCEQKYGPGTMPPDSVTNILLLAALTQRGATDADLEVLITEHVIEPFYRDLWKVWLTGRAEALLDPDGLHPTPPPAPATPVGALPEVTDLTTTLPSQDGVFISIPTN